MQHFGKVALRVTKNYTKGYSDTQTKVRDATCNDPWGPSGTQMNEIAQLTYNPNDFIEIMEILDKRLNDKGKNWRHVFKSLTVLDYLLHEGSENVMIYCQDNIYVIKTLREFQFVDEDGKDQGANVRQKAKDISNLLHDEDRLREERRSRASMRDRMLGGAENAGHGDGELDDENAVRRHGSRELAGKRPNRDEEELRKAIEESKKSLDKERMTAEDRDLQEALRLSRQEDEKRKKEIEDANTSALFDDTNQLSLTNPFPFVDPGLQTQFTSLQPQFTAVPVQPQFTSFNPYQQMAQVEQEAAQAEFLRQQQLLLMQQQQQQAQQQAQEDWMRQQQLLFQQQQQRQSFFLSQPSLQAQPTGFGHHNPFASSSLSSFSSSPPPRTIQTPPTFNLHGTYETHSPTNLSSLSSSPHPPSSQSPTSSFTSFQSQPRPALAVKTKQDENETLAALFADREGGQDTFGNVGALRYGYTDAGRTLIAQKTGVSSHNPFAHMQQQQQTPIQNNERPFFDI
ncbi:hypothetical protein CPB84DRAFT_1680188 [Gymnopilus junonius]|uniref:ENTH domain-containing protein n=1 Tax=Gymnopilus junonius TaxID=109634 RepID=A0A9P5NL21_GYMJU|nr:hypothetical protein CPB84DRAFT_1680188 [Gymnopilus junonius]